MKRERDGESSPSDSEDELVSDASHMKPTIKPVTITKINTEPVDSRKSILAEHKPGVRDTPINPSYMKLTNVKRSRSNDAPNAMAKNPVLKKQSMAELIKSQYDKGKKDTIVEENSDENSDEVSLNVDSDSMSNEKSPDSRAS